MTQDRDSLPLVLFKALVAASGVLLFLWPLATPPGLMAGVAGTLLAYLLAHLAGRGGLRVSAGLALAVLTVVLGQLAGQWILDRAPTGGTVHSIELSDGVFFGLAALGTLFAIRLLSQRARVFSVLELAVVVGAVAHTFAAHRHQRIHQPRFLSDWAWSQGIDPATILAAAGVAAIGVAALLLLRTRRAAKVLLTLIFLLAGALAAFYFGARHARIQPDPDTNGIGLTKDSENQQKDQNSGGGSSSRPPDPVAVVLLHEDLPDAPVLYFRQAVLSRFAVDRLVEDKSGRFDRDIMNVFPAGQPRRIESPQTPAFHRELTTSVFLLVDHAQPFGLGHPIEMRPLENPDPRRFVLAYDVDSRFFPTDVGRVVGRPTLPESWSAEEKAHYTTLPADPRYRALSDRLVREMDPRFVGDDVMKALVMKRYLEKEGFYSIKQKTLVGDDPTGKFLFGEMKGYCVHFAHAATFLLRSQGIPARVALGYAVQTNRRGAGSSILILGSEAHAWPEMYVDGVGWVTFDIYPERSDEPPPAPVDVDLESMLGELARKDKTAGKAEDPNTRLVIPWEAIGLGALSGIGFLLLVAYAIKLVRALRGSSHRLVYRAVLDRLSEVGAGRRPGETRERHATRLAHALPSFVALTAEHLRAALGKADADTVVRMRAQARAARAELRRHLGLWRRLGGLLNPIGWWFTR